MERTRLAAVVLVLALATEVLAAPQLVSLGKNGEVGVNFGGYHASAGLGGLLDGGASGGLHAEAGTPHGQEARAGLAGSVDTKPKGVLYGLEEETGAGTKGIAYAEAHSQNHAASASLSGETVAKEDNRRMLGVLSGGIGVNVGGGLSAVGSVLGSGAAAIGALGAAGARASAGVGSAVAGGIAGAMNALGSAGADASAGIGSAGAAGLSASMGAVSGARGSASIRIGGAGAATSSGAAASSGRSDGHAAAATGSNQQIIIKNHISTNYVTPQPSKNYVEKHYISPPTPPPTFAQAQLEAHHANPPANALANANTNAYANAYADNNVNAHGWAGANLGLSASAGAAGGFGAYGRKSYVALPPPREVKVVHKKVHHHPIVEKRVDVAYDYGYGSPVNADAEYSTKVKLSHRNPTFFSDIFNIPIQVLSSVSRLVGNTVAGTNISVEKSAYVHADKDTGAASKSLGTDAAVQIKTPSASSVVDDIFAIPINTLGAVNKFLENNVPARRKVIVQSQAEEGDDEPTQIRLKGKARRRAARRPIIVRESASHSHPEEHETATI